MNLLDIACPMGNVFTRVGAQLSELARITADADDGDGDDDEAERGP